MIVMCSRWNINKNINVILFELFETDDKVFLEKEYDILFNEFTAKEYFEYFNVAFF